jgi:RimJ/RimL family protein N-acetyltransferase
MFSLLPLDDRRTLAIRPVRHDDGPRLGSLYASLSDESRRRRFLGTPPRLSERELRYLTEIDHRTHVALAAVDPRTGELLAEGRYAPWTDRERTADLALTVADALQGRRVGTTLARALVERARDNDVALLTGSTMGENAAARAIMRRLGFQAVGRSRGVVDYELRLA